MKLRVGLSVVGRYIVYTISIHTSRGYFSLRTHTTFPFRCCLQTRIPSTIFLEGDVNKVKSRENYEYIKNTFIFHLPPTGNRRTKFKREHTTHKKHENHFCGISSSTHSAQPYCAVCVYNTVYSRSIGVRVVGRCRQFELLNSSRCGAAMGITFA